MEGGLSYFLTPTGALKVLETLSVVVAFAIFRGGDSTLGNEDANYFGTGVMVTAMIVTPLLLVCYLMGKLEIQKTIFEAAFNCLMFLFLGAAGGVAVYTWSGKHPGVDDKEKDKGLVMGSFCLIASFAYLADAVLAVVEYRK